MNKHRSFLKWAGGKYLLLDKILVHLPPATTLVEPFVGAGSVFLNTHYDHYLLADINPDLIGLFNYIKRYPDRFIKNSKQLFTEQNNSKDAFYRLRAQFNQTTKIDERAVLFLYLNRHGFNGLCRYNSKGLFNVPFGRYTNIYFPEKELLFFAEKAQRATFKCVSYKTLMKKIPDDSVVYCDPPYYPLPSIQSFTRYHTNAFTLNDQKKLAQLAFSLSQQNIPVVISNHNLTETQHLYQPADIIEFEVRRMIGASKTSRIMTSELLALFHPKPHNC